MYLMPSICLVIAVTLVAQTGGLQGPGHVPILSWLDLFLVSRFLLKQTFVEFLLFVFVLFAFFMTLKALQVIYFKIIILTEGNGHIGNSI